MILLVGVGHVFDISDQVRSQIHSQRPDAVLVELDLRRYRALRQRANGVEGKRSGGPMLYRMMARFQRRMAKEFGGGEAGEEMLAAIDAAHEIGAEVQLIDVDAAAMFDRLLKEMSMKERLWLLLSVFGGLLSSRRKVEEELESYQSDEEAYIAPIRARFPTVVRILIDERNEHMANRIAAIAPQMERVMAVIGDGHVTGIAALLDDEVDIVRLADLGPPGGTSEARLSYTIGFD